MGAFIDCQIRYDFRMGTSTLDSSHNYKFSVDSSYSASEFGL